MSTQYKSAKEVPTEALIARLNELADYVTKGADSVRREFTMRVPAEHDRDADLVLSEAARRLAALESQQAAQPQVPDTWGRFVSYLIDNYEGEAISEELFQIALGAVVASSQ